MSKIKVISFDFLGVLTRGEKSVLYEKILFEILRKDYSKKISKKKIEFFFEKAIFLDKIEKNKKKSINFNKIFDKFLKENNIEIKYKKEILDKLFDDKRSFYCLRHHVRDTLEKLHKKKIKIVLTTNVMFPTYSREYMLRHWKINEYFDCIFTSQEYGRKEGLKIFEKIISHYNVKPNQIIHIGDKIDEDIAPSSYIGLRSCLFIGKNRQEQLLDINIKPDYCVNNFKDINKLISNINNQRSVKKFVNQ